jgi:hypothetical protein
MFIRHDGVPEVTGEIQNELVHIPVPSSQQLT